MAAHWSGVSRSRASSSPASWWVRRNSASVRVTVVLPQGGGWGGGAGGGGGGGGVAARGQDAHLPSQPHPPAHDRTRMHACMPPHSQPHATTPQPLAHPPTHPHLMGGGSGARRTSAISTPGSQGGTS